MKTITISLARMTNELHVQFHESVLTLIERITAAILGIDALYTLYKSAFTEESDALLIITRSEFTEQISEQDGVRDSIYRGFSDTVKGLRNHFDFETRALANMLWNVFLHYGNIAKKTLDEQTAATNDILREFEKPDLNAAIVRLKLDDWRSKLAEENQKLHELVMHRYTEAAGITTVRMKTSRTETDKFYRAIASHADNQIIIGASAEMTEFVTELNEIIKRYKAILAQRLAKRVESGEEITE
jgi:hypothetical protein